MDQTRLSQKSHHDTGIVLSRFLYDDDTLFGRATTRQDTNKQTKIKDVHNPAPTPSWFKTTIFFTGSRFFQEFFCIDIHFISVEWESSSDFIA